MQLLEINGSITDASSQIAKLSYFRNDDIEGNDIVMLMANSTEFEFNKQPYWLNLAYHEASDFSNVSNLLVETFCGSTNGFNASNCTHSQFNDLSGIDINDTTVFVADAGNNVIFQITDSLVSIFSGSGTSGYLDGSKNTSKYSIPTGLTKIDTDILMTDTENNVIRKIAPNGTVLTILGSNQYGWLDGPAPTGEFKRPQSIYAKNITHIYIVDTENNVIRLFDGTAVSTFAGSGQYGYLNGFTNIAQFKHPTDMTKDSSGNFYIVDSLNHCIRKITTNGTVITWAGTGVPGYKDGLKNEALFHNPNGIAIDNFDNIYIADTFNHRIRKIDTAGIVSTLAGNEPGYEDGNSLFAKFYKPTKLAVSSSNEVYVLDSGNSVIRKIFPQQNTPIITSIFPNVIPKEGGIIVTIYGYFPYANGSYCDFYGASMVVPTFINISTIQCVSPSRKFLF